MPIYNVTIRYNDGGTPTSAPMQITAASPEFAYTQDGYTYRFVDDDGISYVVPETALIYMRFEEIP